jgi:hypothetical protein
MTAFRLISLPVHGALELVIGVMLMVAPFALGFSTAGALTSVVIGVLLFGLALAAGSSDVATIDISAHHAYDLGIALGLLGAALVLAITGDGIAAGTLLVAALGQLALNATTRYSRPG